MSNDNLSDEIKQAQKWQYSRYKIDKELLDKGYDPIEIDNAWKEAEPKSPLPKKTRLLRFFIVMGLWLGIAILLLGVFHLPAIILSSLNLLIFPLLSVFKDKKI